MAPVGLGTPLDCLGNLADLQCDDGHNTVCALDLIGYWGGENYPGDLMVWFIVFETRLLVIITIKSIRDVWIFVREAQILTKHRHKYSIRHIIIH